MVRYSRYASIVGIFIILAVSSVPQKVDAFAVISKSNPAQPLRQVTTRSSRLFTIRGGSDVQQDQPTSVETYMSK